MTPLSSGTPEVSVCPNCHGEGYEDTPPMRRCGVCKGRGRLPEAPSTDRIGCPEKPQQNEAQAVKNG